MNPARQAVLTMHPESDSLGLRELRATLPGANVRVVKEIEAGVLVVGLDTADFDVLAAAWREAPPIFVRHMFPVNVSTATVDADTVYTMTNAVLGLITPDKHFSVQTRILADFTTYKPFNVNQFVAERVIEVTNAILDIRAPEQVISVVIGGTMTFQAAYMGVSLARDNLSPWVGGNRRFARTASRISRSEFKLLEAFDVFGLSPEPGGAALDLGAAPGGWSRLLRERGLRVTAVDPAKLDDRLRGDKDLRHIRTTAKKFLQQKPEKYDLIVNDMRMDARKSAQLMVSCAPYLNPGGFGIMTLKLPEEKREIVIDEAYQILSGTFRIAGARQLFHNRSEITVYLRLP